MVCGADWGRADGTRGRPDGRPSVMLLVVSPSSVPYTLRYTLSPSALRTCTSKSVRVAPKSVRDLQVDRSSTLSILHARVVWESVVAAGDMCVPEVCGVEVPTWGGGVWI